MVTVRQILEAINQIAPWDSAESWDQVGLQVGASDREVARALVALDLRPEVIAEGLRLKVDGFITHHPLLFRPLSRIDLRTPLGKAIQTLIQNDLFLIAAHTNVDKAARGLNDYLATQLGLVSTEPLEPSSTQSLCKIVVFVPESHCKVLRVAMAKNGAGVIGNYQECAFEMMGTGSFRPTAVANPRLGNQEQLNRVAEVRLEMVANQNAISRIIQAIHSHHPYEEPAVDLIPLLNSSGEGLGRIGELTIPLRFTELCQLVKERLNPQGARFSGDPAQNIRRVAICSGSGGSLLKTALRRGADLYITGDLDYHDFLTAQEEGLAVIDAGHWATERGFIQWMTTVFDHQFGTENGFEAIPSVAIQTEPFRLLD